MLTDAYSYPFPSYLAWDATPQAIYIIKDIGLMSPKISTNIIAVNKENFCVDNS